MSGAAWTCLPRLESGPGVRALAAVLLVAPLLAGDPPEWSRPVPPFHIAGPVSFVGTEELGCYLIRGSTGCILINTGLEDSPKLILKNLEALGVDRRQVNLLLTNQAHSDHVGGFSKMQKLTGARIWATVRDAPLLESGGAADPSALPRYKAVHVDRLLSDGEEMVFGDLRLKVMLTPGHTPGSVSYLLSYPEGGATRTVLFANLPTVVMPLKNAKYPAIVSDLRLSFARLKALHPDVWVAAHVSQCGLLDKAKTGRFEDADGYAKAVAACEADFETKLKAESP